MFHDIDYTVAQNIGAKDVKNRKLEADEKWLNCFKPRTPYDMLAYSAIKTKKTGPGNPVEKQVDFHPYTGQIYKVNDPPSSNNDRCSMLHDIKYTVAENIGQNPKDIKNRKLDADKEWLDCFKVRSPYDMLAYSAIKTKKTLGLGNNFTMEDLSNELNRPTIQKFERKKVIVNHINEIHSTDLVDMTQYSKINKGYKYIFTNIDVFSKYAYAFPLISKKYKILNLVLKKYFKKTNRNIFGQTRNHHFYLKKCKSFSKTTMLKYILLVVI